MKSWGLDRLSLLNLALFFLWEWRFYMAACWSNPSFQTYVLLHKVPSCVLLSPGTLYTFCVNWTILLLQIWCRMHRDMTWLCSQGTELISSALSLSYGNAQLSSCSWRHLMLSCQVVIPMSDKTAVAPLSEEGETEGFECLTRHMWSWEEANPLAMWCKQGFFHLKGAHLALS